MCESALKSGWLVIYAAELDDGYSIEFLNTSSGFGDLESASIFEKADKPLFANQSWVHTRDLGQMLLNMMQDRADLMCIPDFDDACNASDEGAPLVWLHLMLCRSCGHEWKAVFDAPRQRVRCGKCSSIVEIPQDLVEWVGPANPILRELWEKLPPVGIEAVELGNGFKARTISAGVVVMDDLGNRIELSNLEDGLGVIVHNGGARVRLQMTVHAKGFSIEETEGET